MATGHFKNTLAQKSHLVITKPPHSDELNSSLWLSLLDQPDWIITRSEHLALKQTSVDLKDTNHCSVMTEHYLQLIFVFTCFSSGFLTDAIVCRWKNHPFTHTNVSCTVHPGAEILPTLGSRWASRSLPESGSWRPPRWVSSWAQAARCCTQEAAARPRQGRASTSDPSASPGWPGPMWVGSVVQAQCWPAAWCG